MGYYWYEHTGFGQWSMPIVKKGVPSSWSRQTWQTCHCFPKTSEYFSASSYLMSLLVIHVIAFQDRARPVSKCCQMFPTSAEQRVELGQLGQNLSVCLMLSILTIGDISCLVFSVCVRDSEIQHNQHAIQIYSACVARHRFHLIQGWWHYFNT